MSARVRDAVLTSITGAAGPGTTGGSPDVAAAALALAAAIQDAPDALGRSETALLRDWLDRLAAV
jgi:hypothetical protein